MSKKIGVDISGGDFAPQETLQGAILAKKEFNCPIVLIGNQQQIEKLANQQHIDLSQFEVVNAPQKIEMSDPPAMSIRRKKKSSIVVGLRMLKRKQIDAFVSCGNTGAVVSGSTLFVRLIEGVERPGIGVLFPTTSKEPSMLIDVGASISPKPFHLLQYAVMASSYYSLVLGKEKPTVGLLNIGEESIKGSDFIRRTHKLFSSSALNFIGNIEAKEVFSGRCNCVVCDGFMGNIALKISEGLSKTIGTFLSDAVREDFLAKIGFLFMKRSLRAFKKKVDYVEYGGAPLLGVNGVVIIGHGSSSAQAVKNAVRVALEEVERDFLGKMKGSLGEICKDSRVRQALTGEGTHQ
jgi:glycerol-3-phosphate acyltransferase PlsX